MRATTPVMPVALDRLSAVIADTQLKEFITCRTTAMRRWGLPLQSCLSHLTGYLQSVKPCTEICSRLRWIYYFPKKILQAVSGTLQTLSSIFQGLDSELNLSMVGGWICWEAIKSTGTMWRWGQPRCWNSTTTMYASGLINCGGEATIPKLQTNQDTDVQWGNSEDNKRVRGLNNLSESWCQSVKSKKIMRAPVLRQANLRALNSPCCLPCARLNGARAHRIPWLLFPAHKNHC